MDDGFPARQQLAADLVAGATADVRHQALKRALLDFAVFSRHVVGVPLRSYQLAPARAILDSVFHRRGRTFTVMLPRQAGKNELSAQLEAYLLILFSRVGGSIVKAAPTFKPQAVTSKQRLERVLAESPFTRGRWSSHLGYILRYGRAQVLFFSAAESANVVGATASVLLEIDEAQDVDPEKFQKDFRPMGATANVTTVLYGTAWTEDTLLEQLKREHLRLEAEDGVRRHFEYPWTAVAAANPLYGRYVEAEMARLGVDHPLVRTQYLLQPLASGGRLFDAAALAQLRGDHGRQDRALDGRTYVAGVDVAGEAEEATDAALRAAKPRQDSTVVTVGEVEHRDVGGVREPFVRVVAWYWWTGRPHREQVPQLVDLLKNVWRCRRVCVDATGMGAPVASFLVGALGARVVEPYVFTAPGKSHLGYELLAAVHAGRLKAPDDGSPEAEAFWREARLAQRELRGNQVLDFHVDPTHGHDDFLMSLGLCVHAARALPSRVARGRETGGEAWPVW